MPGPWAGNPPTYEALRARTSVYVEYATGEKEYHDLATDPYELRNTFSSLSSEQKAALHASLEALRSCRGVESCRAAARGGRGVKAP